MCKTQARCVESAFMTMSGFQIYKPNWGPTCICISKKFIPTVSSNPTACVTPTRKRTLESDPPPPVKKRAESGLMSNSSSIVVLVLDTDSPPVTVSFTKIN